MEFKKYTISEIATLKYGKMLASSDFTDTGYPVYSGYRVTGYTNKFLYEKPMLVIVARGVGGTGDVKISPPKSWITNLSIVLDLNEEIADKYFLKSLLNTHSLKDKLNTGSAQSQITIEVFSNYEIQLPDISDQKEISYILSTYDDLIENNQRRIRILEDMAQSLYREWFVHFRFPGHETTPMIDSPLGPIPQGWRVAQVEDLIEKLKRKEKIQKNYYLVNGNWPVIDQGKDFIGGYTNDASAIYHNPLPMIVFGDHTRVLKYVDFPFASGADGTQLLYPKSHLSLPIHLYHLLISIDLSSYSYARHFKFLKSSEVILPTFPLIENFEEICMPLYSLRSKLMAQILNLQKTRDLVLPKLISGEIDLSTAASKLKDAA